MRNDKFRFFFAAFPIHGAPFFPGVMMEHHPVQNGRSVREVALVFQDETCRVSREKTRQKLKSLTQLARNSENLPKQTTCSNEKTLVESMLDALVLVVETTISKMFWQIGSFPQILSGVNIIWKTSIWNTTHVWSFFPSNIFLYPMESMHAYIYPHEWLTFMVNVGKDSSPMNPVGRLL